LLGSCGTLTPDQIAGFSATAKAYAQAFCGYVAPISEVATLVAQFVPGAGVAVDIGTQVGTRICQVATGAAAAQGGAIIVDGVAIHGHFIAGRRHR
jgi:hypothetical protein